MTAPLYTVNVTLASLANVPPRGEKAAHLNASRAFGIGVTMGRNDHPHFVCFTESWHRSTRRGIFAAAPMKWGFIKPVRNSAVLAYDRYTWKLIKSGSLLLHGIVAGRFGLVSDPRRMPWGVFEHRATGRRIVVGAVHLAPKGSRKGPAAVAASRLAHARAFDRLDTFVNRFDYPVLLGGDWNTETPQVGDRSVGVGIDRVVMVHGKHSTFDLADVSRYQLPASDHPGARVSLPVVAP